MITEYSQNLTLQYFVLSFIFLICLIFVFSVWMYARWHIWGPRYKKLGNFFLRIFVKEKGEKTASSLAKEISQIDQKLIDAERQRVIDSNKGINTSSSVNVEGFTTTGQNTTISGQELIQLQQEKQKLIKKLEEDKERLLKKQKSFMLKIMPWKKKAIEAQLNEIGIKEDVKAMADLLGTSSSSATDIKNLNDAKDSLAAKLQNLNVGSTPTSPFVKPLTQPNPTPNPSNSSSTSSATEKVVNSSNINSTNVNQKPSETNNLNEKASTPIKEMESETVKAEYYDPVTKKAEELKSTDIMRTIDKRKYKWEVIQPIQWRGVQISAGGKIEDTDNSYMRKLATEGKVKLPTELEGEKK